MADPVAGHGLAEVADAGAFLARLVRFDPATLVRLRATGGSRRVELWARLPWGVLVSRTVAGSGAGSPAGVGPTDVTVAAADLLAELGRGGTALPPRRDADWRWPLPGSDARTVETLPAAELWRIAAAAEQTLRSAARDGVAGRAVGQRALRDALLDHVPIVVTSSPAAPGDRPVRVPQRLVQAVSRMGFLGGAEAPAVVPPSGPRPVDVEGDRVHVRVVGRWTGLVAPYGSAWLLASSQLSVKPIAPPPIG